MLFETILRKPGFLKKLFWKLFFIYFFRTKTEPINISEKNIKENKELAKLQLFGAGPKMRGLGIYPTDGKDSRRI